MATLPDSFHPFLERAREIIRVRDAERDDAWKRYAEDRQAKRSEADQRWHDDYLNYLDRGTEGDRRHVEYLYQSIIESAEGQQLEDDLFALAYGYRRRPSRSGEGSRGVKLRPVFPLEEVLKSLTFVEDLRAGDSAEAIRARLEAGVIQKPIERAMLVELLGCDFPREFGSFRNQVIFSDLEFEFGSRAQAAHSWTVDEALRAQMDAALSEPPSELPPLPNLDHRAWNSQRNWDGKSKPGDGRKWYIVKTKNFDGTALGGSLSRWQTREEILDKFWPDLLILALSHGGLFNVSKAIASVPGWDMTTETIIDVDSDDFDSSSPWWKYKSPGREASGWSEWADQFYGISEGEWGNFEAFRNLIVDSRVNGVKSKSLTAKVLYPVARWFLRGRLLEHPDLSKDEFNDVLLHYVTCLENLVMRSGEKDGINDKLASRLAWMVGRNDAERSEIYEFVKQTYSRRSQTVHRSEKKSKRLDKSKADFQRIRDVCRRAIACAIMVAGKSDKPDYFDDQFLRRLLISQQMQSIAQEAATQIGQLTRCF